MTQAFIFDLSYTLLFPKDDNYSSVLNDLYRSLSGSRENYDFWEFFKLNHELLDIIGALKPRYPLYVFTSGSIHENPVLKVILDQYFTQVFSAQKDNLPKDKSASYIYLSRIIALRPNEILFIDDQPANITAASAAGINAVLYGSFDKIKKYLSVFMK